MKIAHLITGLGVGGAERQLKALVSDRENPSSTQIIISLKDEGIIGKQLACQPGVRVHCLNLDKSFLGLWRLYKILRREKPDVLQTWLYHANLIGLVIGKVARVPHIVWNIRCSNIELSQFSRATVWFVKFLKFLSRFPDALITNSKAGQEFHKQLGYKPRKWVQIPNGIDTELFQPNALSGQELRQSLNIPENAMVIGMLGRVHPMKDYTTFLTAMEHLTRENENLYCIVAGKGTENAVWSIVPSRLRRLGVWENAPQFLNALDIMVLSSAAGEGFPNVVGEAMACGKPTIVTDVGDAAAIVQTNTQIVPPQDVDKLILALKGLIALSSRERIMIGQQSRKKVESTYSLSMMRQRYASFYSSLI